jgi:hypothetical protein
MNHDRLRDDGDGCRELHFQSSVSAVATGGEPVLRHNLIFWIRTALRGAGNNLLLQRFF